LSGYAINNIDARLILIKALKEQYGVLYAWQKLDDQTCQELQRLGLKASIRSCKKKFALAKSILGDFDLGNLDTLGYKMPYEELGISDVEELFRKIDLAFSESLLYKGYLIDKVDSSQNASR
jgi:hypothetical protein